MRFRGRVGIDGWLLPLICIFLNFYFFQWGFLYQWIICGTLKVIYREFPSSPVVRTSSFHCKGHVWSLVGKLRQWHPTPVLLPGKSMDGGAWRAAVHGVAESRTRLSDFTFTFHFHALEREVATHSSVLAWRIPGMGKPGGLPSMGLHRLGHNWSDSSRETKIPQASWPKSHVTQPN